MKTSQLSQLAWSHKLVAHLRTVFQTFIVFARAWLAKQKAEGGPKGETAETLTYKI
jgi:hypothetical protein